MTDRDALAALLYSVMEGIDSDDPVIGWWETSYGAASGKERAEALIDAILAAGWRAPIGEWTDNGAWAATVAGSAAARSRRECDPHWWGIAPNGGQWCIRCGTRKD